MIRIGDFSKLSRVSIKTLRYYDEMGLFKPIDVDRLFDEVYGFLARHGVNGPDLVGAAIWHDEEFKTSDIDGEAVVYLKQAIPAGEHVKVYELPAVTVASVIHKGAFNTFNQAYEAVLRWIEANGYKIVGPNREVYLYCTQPVRQDDDSYVTEIQFPVTKREP